MPISVLPARLPRQNRRPTQTDKRPTGRVKSYLPPTAGVITNTALAAPGDGSARVLENVWARKTGISPRGGTNKRVDVAGSAEFLFAYIADGANEYFVADATNIYEFSDATADDTTLSATITGQTNSDYTALETQTDAGSFIHLVNGADDLQLYDGTSWQAVDAASSPHAITGVTTADLSHVFSHVNRVWFIEKNSMKAWYLATNAISGAATKFSLSGVFKKGGVLLFGSTWSSDSGAGLDDRLAFVTDQGEVAVYSGTDPASASNWTLQGVYSIGTTLSKNSHVRIGGDLYIGTKSGFVPLSAVVQKDASELGLVTLERAIRPDFDEQVALAGSNVEWLVAKWDKEDAIVIAPPQDTGVSNFAFVFDAESSACSGRFTGWNIESMAVLGGNLHYGDADGNVYQCEVGGQDEGVTFECRGCLAFDSMDSPSSYKTASAIRGVWRYKVPINPQHSITSDYAKNFPTAPAVATLIGSGDSAWDVSDWDTSDWGTAGSESLFVSDWESVSEHGVSLAPQFQLSSGASYKLDCELVRIDVLWTEGAPI